MVAVISMALSSGSQAIQSITIQEPFGLAWGPDLVHENLEFPRGQAAPDSLVLTDAEGNVVPSQLTDLELWEDGSVKSGNLWFLATLEPNEEVVWKLTTETQAAPAPAGGVEVKEKDGMLEITNALTGIRLPAGKKTFDPPAEGEMLPGPLQGIRLQDGRWIGKGGWKTDIGCVGYEVEVVEQGPVLARVRMRFDFEDGRTWSATVELGDDQDLAVIRETFNLGEGKLIPMEGLYGMKPGDKYVYIVPQFDPPEMALTWDWWMQTMANLPSPNQWYFSFGKELRPDSVEFIGNNRFGNLQEGDGGLKYDKDGRFAYINAFPQHGDEETLFLGFYDSKQPENMLAVVGLLPGEWLHPDIHPHAYDRIQQYVQTNCVTFERRKDGDVFFTAPVSLGKRVLGIGGMKRTFERHPVVKQFGIEPDVEESWRSPVMLRHVRRGRLPLDTVKDWILDYDEPAKYPRLFVDEGDRVTYESRRTRRPVEEVRAELEERQEPTAEEQKQVVDALNSARALLHHVLQANRGVMTFGIDAGRVADQAEDALASPACTPEQAEELRRLLAAIVYACLDENYIPPRTAGFAWGSANMMSQAQNRTARIAGLLPNHPLGSEWREQLARAITMTVLNQINEHGATLENPHYGTMAIVMPAMALGALTSAGDVDVSDALERLSMAGRLRLGYLLPPDPRGGGMRSLSPQGDGYYQVDPVPGVLSGLFRNKDPQLARELAWASGEVSAQPSDDIRKLVDVERESSVPDLKSALYDGTGLVLREGFPADDETFLQIFAPNFSHGHGHNDWATWIFYAMGAPLMMDFAAMYTPSIRQHWQHPGGLTFNHDETVRAGTDDPEDAWWKSGSIETLRNQTKAPFTVVEIRDDPIPDPELGSLGKVTAFEPEAKADYVELQRLLRYFHQIPYLLEEPHGEDFFMDSDFQEVVLRSPFVWTRRFLFVKEHGPDSRPWFAFRDDLRGNTELDPYLNLWALADDVEVKGQTIVWKGQHGVDVYGYVAEPAKFEFTTQRLGHEQGVGFARAYKEIFDKPFREDQLLVRVAQESRDGGYLVAIVPVRQGEPAPRFSTLKDGKGIQVEFSDRTDIVLLQQEPEEVMLEGQKVKTAAALVQKRGNKVDVFEFSGENP